MQTLLNHLNSICPVCIGLGMILSALIFTAFELGREVYDILCERGRKNETK